MRGYAWGVRAALAVTAAGILAAPPALAADWPHLAGSWHLAAGSARLVANPYSPAYQHAYRRGVVPFTGRLPAMRTWARSHRASPRDLSYGGGIDGIGVTTGREKVYLVFYGSQWGSRGTDGRGDVTLTGDPSGEAPYLQRLFRGLGTGRELWSGVMTLYCQGVTVGTQVCPAGNQSHVAYPTGGALAGVWVDETAASPGQATGHQLGAEAVKAAAHFGNTTAAANRNAQYVILSPTGTNPDGFNTASGNFCAWHDYNGDTTLSGGPVSSPDGDIAFTNMPYVTDAGASCGQNFVNQGTAGNLDGVSIVEGHEYAETITDQNPVGGWTDSSGEENGDKCAWLLPGSTGGAGDVTLGTSGFAMQSTWANDAGGGAGGCELSHPIVTGSPGSGSVVNGGFETGTFSGWTTSGPATAIVSAGAHSGSYAARAGATTAASGSSSIVQTFTAAGATLTFWYNMTCTGTVSHEWTIATLRDNGTGRTTAILPKMCVARSGWRQVSHTVTSGHSYTLTLTSHDGNRPADPAYTLFDDVAVQ
jgi:hypothetical protein